MTAIGFVLCLFLCSNHIVGIILLWQYPWKLTSSGVASGRFHEETSWLFKPIDDTSVFLGAIVLQMLCVRMKAIRMSSSTSDLICRYPFYRHFAVHKNTMSLHSKRWHTIQHVLLFDCTVNCASCASTFFIHTRLFCCIFSGRLCDGERWKTKLQGTLTI